MDKIGENTYRTCYWRTALANMEQPENRQPLKPLEWPHTWDRLHMDFAGPIDDQMILVVVDAHTKWPEIVVMHRATSTPTIKACQLLFFPFWHPERDSHGQW